MEKQNIEIMHRLLFIAALVAALALAGCRGMESDEPPIHLNLNMDFQKKFEPQEANAFFDNEAAMRTPPPGTVARGMLRENTVFYEGLTEDGGYVEQIPVSVTRALIERGQERYNIYCAVCHGRAGDGQGVISRGGYGWVIPGYHTERLRQIEDGYLYEVIANGLGTMPGYAGQIPVADRWAIVAYVRALQRSQYATEADVPPSVRINIEPAGPAATADTTAAGATAADTTAADTTQ